MALLPKEAAYSKKIPRPDHPDHQPPPVGRSAQQRPKALANEIAPDVRVALLEDRLMRGKRDGAERTL
jgi:hypothetical protein